MAAVAIAACGGGSPAGPSSAQGVSLSGRVVGGPVGFASASSGASSAVTLTVKVQETGDQTTITTDGTFTLRGLPEGAFILEFWEGGVGGTLLGTIAFTEVNPNQQITITVSLDGGTVTLLEQRRNGIGHGDVEIEGLVEVAPATPDPNTENTFTIDGYTVVTRPLETSIREGNRRRTVADVTQGRRVHVKGVWETSATGGQQVLAHEIKLQADDEGDDGGGKNTWCPDSGNKAEVEGKITAPPADPTIRVTQQGKGDFLVTVDSSTRIRKGNTTLTFADLKQGNRVHVKGTSQGLSGETCGVQASEVKLQN
ncbi:MAG TPA: DUF5666 domain-containing protein [Vicinamibacteria bacterium]|nr:DUF5666 domain-containing protein [Vicinamibacteria bacterium]